MNRFKLTVEIYGIKHQTIDWYDSYNPVMKASMAIVEILSAIYPFDEEKDNVMNISHLGSKSFITPQFSVVVLDTLKHME